MGGESGHGCATRRSSPSTPRIRNTVLYICGEQIGMNAANMLVTQVNMAVEAQDFYYGGPGDIVTAYGHAVG